METGEEINIPEIDQYTGKMEFEIYLRKDYVRKTIYHMYETITIVNEKVDSEWIERFI